MDKFEGVTFSGTLNAGQIKGSISLPKDTAAIKLDWLYDVGDRTSFKFAQFIREQFETNAARNGFARRLVNLKSSNSGQYGDGDVTLKFKRNNLSERDEEMKEQMTAASEEHYVREDRRLFDNIRRNLPPSQIIERSWSEFTPRLIAEVRNLITDQKVPVSAAMMHSQFWNQFIGNPDFFQIIDPEIRHERVLLGYMASMLGMSLQSDAFRHPTHKVLEPGEMFFFADPLNVGELDVYGLPEKDQYNVGLLIEETDTEIEWKFPHDFYFSKLDYTKIALLRVK